MPSAIKKDRELKSKGLVSILLERQGHTQEDVEAFLLKTFPDNGCFVAAGGSVPTPEFRGIPHAVVIGVDGTLLFDGSPLGDSQKMEAVVQAELVKVQKGWGDTADARKVRAMLYGKNNLDAARAAVEAMAESEEKNALAAEVAARFATLRGSVAALQAQGRWLDAQAAAKDLVKAIGNHKEWADDLAPLLGAFDSEEGKAELALDKKLEKVLRQLREKKREGAPKALQAILKGAPEGSRVAARAGHLMRVLGGLR